MSILCPQEGGGGESFESQKLEGNIGFLGKVPSVGVIHLIYGLRNIDFILRSMN